MDGIEQLRNLATLAVGSNRITPTAGSDAAVGEPCWATPVYLPLHAELSFITIPRPALNAHNQQWAHADATTPWPMNL